MNITGEYRFKNAIIYSKTNFIFCWIQNDSSEAKAVDKYVEFVLCQIVSNQYAFTLLYIRSQTLET